MARDAERPRNVRKCRGPLLGGPGPQKVQSWAGCICPTADVGLCVSLCPCESVGLRACPVSSGGLLPKGSLARAPTSSTSDQAALRAENAGA